MKERSPETIVVRENEIRLVRRPDSERWQAHFKVDAIGKWIRKATGTPNLEKAKAFAEEQWFEAKVLARAGHPVVSKKFKSVADVVLRDLEIKVAEDKTKRGSNNDYISAINGYLIPFFGGYNVDRINQAVFTEFCEWRRQKVGRELSHSAQANHNAALSLVFDYAIERAYMSNMQKPVLKNTGEHGGRRPDFSSQEVLHMASKFADWVQKGRIGRTRELRELLSIYVPFAAATGMRPGTEMEYLEWRHIELRDVGLEKPVLYARIQKGKTVKKNKPMFAVFHESCKTYLARLIELAPELQGKTLEQVLDEKHESRVFRPRNGVQPTHLIAQFSQFLQDLDMLLCPTTGQERTLYSLRHFAITQMIAKGLTAEQIQAQVRTSATMIAKFYNHMSPLMNAAQFSGQGEGGSIETSIAKLLNSTPNDELMFMAELSTGLSISLRQQNKPALEELREELQKTSAAAAPN
jgi:integrase